MGVFDQHIEWLRGRKAIAEQDVEDYIAGAAHFIGGMDFTQSFAAGTQSGRPARNRTSSSSRR